MKIVRPPDFERKSQRPVSRLLAVLAASLAFSTAAIATELPNVVVFVADDIGVGDIRSYNSGSLIPTPNIDTLAAEGMRFTDTHTSASMCAPTRYSIMTGNYHWRGRHAWGQWNYFGKSQILPGQITLADVLREAGYKTAMIGKLHLGGQFYQKGTNNFVAWNGTEDQIDFGRRFRDGPLDYGFDYSFLVPSGIQKPPYAYFENDLLVGDPADLIVWQAGVYGNSWIRHDGIGMPYWDSSDVGPTLVSKAIEFIDDHHQANLVQGSDAPFFLYYSAQTAHAPFTPPENLGGEPVQGVTGVSDHADMIYEADVAIGQLVAALEQRDMLRDTLIVFTSDNGGNIVSADVELGHDSSGGLRGQKGSIWEGGHRVPFIARWGDGTPVGSVIEPNSTSAQLLGVHDLLATLASIAGVRLPVDQARDSFDFLPVLMGEQPTDAPIRESILIESPLSLQSGAIRQFGFRAGDWKLVFDENLMTSGLYDLALDLQESSNRIDDSQLASLVERMETEFFQLRFNERTAPIASGLGASLQGRPDYQAAVDDGIYLWKDTFNGPYHLRISGDGTVYSYDVSIVADIPFTAVSARSLEQNDSLAWTGAGINLSGEVGAGEDGIDFMLPDHGLFMLRVNRDSEPAVGGIWTGNSSDRHISTGWIVGLPEFPPAPSFQGGNSVGTYLGRGASPDTVSVRWNGDGLQHEFESRFVFSRPIVTTSPISIEACCDELSVADNTVHVAGTVSTWWDGLDFGLSTSTQVGFVHLYDGQNQPYYVNPATGEFGLPNAYVVASPSGLGQPEFDPDLDKALFVWRDDDNTWHVRGTAGGDFARYSGSVNASLPFETVQGISLEPNYGDVVETVADGSGQQMNFELRMAQVWYDGIDFRLPPGATATLTIDEAKTTGPVLIGGESWPVELPVIVLQTE